MTHTPDIFDGLTDRLAGCAAACAAAQGQVPDRAAEQDKLDRELAGLLGLQARGSGLPDVQGEMTVTVDDGTDASPAQIRVAWQAHPAAARYLVEVNGRCAGQTDQTQLVVVLPENEPLLQVTLRAYDFAGRELGRMTVRARVQGVPPHDTQTGRINPWQAKGGAV